MADDRERLILEMSANLQRFENSLDRANRAADRRFTALEKRAERAGQRVERSFDRMSGDVRSALATIGVGLALREVGEYADSWTRSGNKIAAAGVALDQVAATQSRLVDLANETRSSYDATADLYAKITRSTAELGANEAQVARAVETVNKALAAGGASAAERNSAILQLGQGLGSGVLQGDELKAIRENSTVLAQAIADEFDTTIGGLKELGAEGKLTSDRVFRAILRGSADVDAQFARTKQTIGDAFTILQNEATRFVGELNDASGAADTFANFVRYVAENLDLLAQAAIIAGAAVGGALAGRGLIAVMAGARGAAVALGVTTTAVQAMGVRAVVAAGSMNALRAAMAFLGGPLGVAITAVGVAVGFYASSMAKASTPSADLEEKTTDLADAVRDYEAASVAASVATGQDAETAKKAAEEKRKLVIQTRDAAQAKLDEARATIALIKARQAERIEFGEMAGRAGGDQGSVAAAGFMNLFDAPALKQAETNANAAAEAIKAAERALATPAGGGRLRTPTTKPGKGKGKTPAEQAQERADIAAATRLEAARLAQNTDLVRTLEREEQLREQIRKYESTGLATAEARKRAAADIAALDDARAEGFARDLADGQRAFELELARERQDDAGIRSLERRIELADRIRTAQEQGLTLAEATAVAQGQQLQIDRARAAIRTRFLEDTRAEHDIEVARLAGDERRLRMLEREQAIRARARDLQENGGLLPGEADARASREQTEIDVAEMRGKFRSAFRDGVRAAVTGDLGSYFEELSADLAEKVLGRNLDALADATFDALAQAFPTLFDATADALGATAAAATIAGGMTTGGAAAATTIGAAIVSAGAAAGATIAAAMATGNATSAAASVAAFAGFRASGGSYMIRNERGPEADGPTNHGVVFSTAAMRGLADLGRLAKQGRIAGGGELNVEIHNNGAPVSATVERQPNGDVKVNLEPLMRQGLDAAGQSGQLERSLRRRPRAKTRG